MSPPSSDGRVRARLTAEEAAARLGIKRETLYAYVSRGLLARSRDDGRTSTFDADEVDALRRGRHGRRSGGLDVALGSRITRLTEDRLWYRGHAIEELAAPGCSFESIAELLWTGELAEHSPWPVDEALVARAGAMQLLLPDATLIIDRLRLSVVAASASDPLRDDRSPVAVAAVGRRLIGALVDALPNAQTGAPTSGRSNARSNAGVTRRPRPVAERLWPHLTTRRASPRLRATLSLALCLLADHELATATVAVRVAASGRADPYSAVLTGLGALAGPLHGGASAQAYEFLATIKGSTTPASAVGERLRDGRRIPGFGHAVYRVDPRAQLLIDHLMPALSHEHAARLGDTIAVVGERVGVAPNVDVVLAALALAAGMGRDAGEAMFAIARVAGWLAHAMEEYDESPLRFRPTARYIASQVPATAT